MNTRTSTQIMVSPLIIFASLCSQPFAAPACSILQQKGPQRSTLAHSRTIHATSVFKCVTARGFLSVRTAHALPAKQAKRPIRRVLLQSLPKRNVYRYLYDAVQELSTHAPIVTKL